MVDEVSGPAGAVHVLAALSDLDRRVARDLRRLLPPELAGMRGSHGRILDQIDDAGSRPSALAAGAWITKQAVAMRIRELEALGWVSVTDDPDDRRAVVVRRTPAGQRVRDAAVTAIGAMEAQWAATVGERRYATFRAVLAELGEVAPDGG